MPSEQHDAQAIKDAIREVVTPQRAKILIGMLLQNAIERRDTLAARTLLERALGRPRNEPMGRLALDLPNGMKTSKDVATAANALLNGIADGKVAPEDAQRTAVIIELARRAIETQELERRIADLEERAKREKKG